MLNTIQVADLSITAASKQAVVEDISVRLANGEKIFITTPYSEFLYASLRSKDTLAMLNTADIAIADGIAILWAAYYLSLPLTASSFYGRVVQGMFQIVYSGAAILLKPSVIKKQVPEKIVGADFFWDLSALAATKNYSIFLAGGFGETTLKVAKILTEKYPNLQIAGTSNIYIPENFEDDPKTAQLIEEIKAKKPDFIFAAFGPIKQERFIAHYFSQLPVKLAIGLGGTFDYVTGTKAAPPQFIRNSGLEWAYRLVTQPRRIKRIWNATFRLTEALLRYKVFSSYPYRKNVVCVVIKDGKVLLCKRKTNRQDDRMFHAGDAKGRFANYWQFPQGGMDTQEEIETTARRELKEEINVSNARYLTTSKHTHSYQWSNSVRPLSLANSRYSYKGQNQHIAYFEFTGRDEEIKVDGMEFENWKWVELADLEQVIHEERRPLAHIILADSREDEVLKKAFKIDKI